MAKEVCDAILDLTLTAHDNRSQDQKVAATNLVQGIGVIGTNLLQQYGLPSAVPGMIAAAQTAAAAPRQGSWQTGTNTRPGEGE